MSHREYGDASVVDRRVSGKRRRHGRHVRLLRPGTDLVREDRGTAAGGCRTASMAMRAWWIAASAGSVVVMAVTFAYFVPELISFAKTAAQPPADVAPRVRRWVALNYIRAVILIAAWIAALKVFSSIV